MRNAGGALLFLFLLLGCSSAMTTGEPGLFSVVVERNQGPAGGTSFRVEVRNVSGTPLEIVDFALRPVEGETTGFEGAYASGFGTIEPGRSAMAGFQIGGETPIPDRVAIDVTFRRGGGVLERRSYRVDVR